MTHFHTFTRDPQPQPFGPFSPIEACPHCDWPTHSCICDDDLPAYRGFAADYPKEQSK